MAYLKNMTPEQIERQAEITKIAEQNDCFRTHALADDRVGRWVFTAAVVAEDHAFQMEAFRKVQEFDDFSEDADPFGSHEMGVLTVRGKTVWWKIDLYDQSYLMGSVMPTDVSKTRRVLTIMFPSDN